MYNGNDPPWHFFIVMEPLALLGIAYLAYLTAELFHFSGIIRWGIDTHLQLLFTMITCALVMILLSTDHVHYVMVIPAVMVFIYNCIFTK